MVARIRNAHAWWQATLAALAIIAASSITTDLFGPRAAPVLSLALAVANTSTAAYYAALAKRNDTTIADLASSMAYWRARASGTSQGDAGTLPDQPRNAHPPGQTPGG